LQAFKSLEKQSWKRRWLYLDGDALTLSWYAAPPPAAGSGGAAARPPPPKGTFAMDVLKVEAAASTDNKRPNELKVQSNNMALYLCTESAAERGELLRRLNAARRRRVCGDDGTALILSEAAGSALGGGGGRGSKVFTWGIGAMLGNGRQDTQAWGQPQLVNALRCVQACGLFSAHSAGLRRRLPAAAILRSAPPYPSLPFLSPALTHWRLPPGRSTAARWMMSAPRTCGAGQSSAA